MPISLDAGKSRVFARPGAACWSLEARAVDLPLLKTLHRAIVASRLAMTFSASLVTLLPWSWSTMAMTLP
jgi:hypothetical protein